MHVAVAAARLGGIYTAGRTLLDASLRPTRSGKKESKGEKDKHEGGGAPGAALGLALMAGGLGAHALAHLARLAVLSYRRTARPPRPMVPMRSSPRFARSMRRRRAHQPTCEPAAPLRA